MKAQELLRQTTRICSRPLRIPPSDCLNCEFKLERRAFRCSSEIRRNRRLIARIKTIQTERTIETVDVELPSNFNSQIIPASEFSDETIETAGLKTINQILFN